MDFVSKKPVIGGIILVVILGMILAGSQINPDNPENEVVSSQVWNVRIAGPMFHDLETYDASLGSLDKGTYQIGFVPMGDSPTKITIKIRDSVGNEFFFEEFYLERNLVDTGISKYYTWEYIGQKYVQIPKSGDDEDYQITVERIGNLEGSVSISLEKVDTSI
jgi:hypothetical protein